MRVLVCGGRHYDRQTMVFAELDRLKTLHGKDHLVVIQGGAFGADKLARDWCYGQTDIHLVNCPADWALHGRAAGPIRNQQMLDKQRPDMILAFPGGRGTEDMVRRAVAANITVRRVLNVNV